MSAPSRPPRRLPPVRQAALLSTSVTASCGCAGSAPVPGGRQSSTQRIRRGDWRRSPARRVWSSSSITAHGEISDVAEFVHQWRIHRLDCGKWREPGWRKNRRLALAPAIKEVCTAPAGSSARDRLR
ncbi:hypothetical protein PVAP13_4KG322700 [Panicum virgatum]|uniref:Uncharacterized protein n=1 Tax=Panicum virgatum TaxID=38727 RepID=A0A8T0TK78_PANVG|nr:hypothetical protein PVAP13_4KG322700 [Panicum virgatum]